MSEAVRPVGSGLAPALLARVAAAAQLATLEDVLRSGLAEQPPWQLAEVIAQDEFTHDVVFAGPAPAYLVFDTT